MPIRWHIGKEAAPLDRPPYRAYFYWVERHRLVRSEDYDATELAAVVKVRRKTRDPKDPFNAALKALIKADTKTR